MFWPSLLACVAPYVFFLGPPVCFPQFCMVLPSLLHSLPRLNGLERGVCQLSVPPFAGCMHLSCVESSMYVLTFTFGLRCFIFHGFSPHLCVGFLFLILYPAVRLPSSSRHTQLAHTQLVITPHNLSTTCHNTTCHHTTCHHTTCHHTTCSHTTCHQTTCSHTTCPHTTCHHTTCSHTTCSHRTSPHTHTQLVLTHRTSPHTHTHNLSSHNLTSTLTLRGRRGTYGTGPALVTRRVPKWRRGRRGSLRGRRGTWWHRRGRRGTWRHGPSLCVAGVALGDMYLHLVTSTLTLRGRRGTYGTGPALVTRRVPKWRRGHRGSLRGRRGTWWHRLSLCVAGVALGDIECHFAWQAWHLATCIFTWWHRRSLCVAGVALTALGQLWWRAGFPNDAVAAAAFCVAGVALGDIDCHFAWQAWHLATWTFTLRGRRGTWRHVSSLGDIDAHFAWQAWHLRHWAGSGDAPGRQMTPWTPRLFAWQAWHLVTSTVTLRGRRGTWWHRVSLCVAGVALGDMHLHLVTSTLTLRGRRGTYGTGPALVARRVPKWRRGHRGSLRGRRGTWWHRLSLCVAGVALGDIDLHFAWQAWHLRHWAGSGGAPGSQMTPWAVWTSSAGVRFFLRLCSGCFLSCRLLCSICCEHDAANGASDRLLTFLAVSLGVFKCRNIHCHFHGSSGANVVASFWRTQQLSAEVSFVANMMQRTELRTDCSRFCLFLCVFKCRNIHYHFHGSSGANAFASFWRTQQNSAEVSTSRTWSDVYIERV